MARIVPTILLHFLHPWRSDVGGRITSGTRLQGRRSRVKHDCMDAGGRATNGAVAEDARTELSKAPCCEHEGETGFRAFL